MLSHALQIVINQIHIITHADNRLRTRKQDVGTREEGYKGNEKDHNEMFYAYNILQYIW